MVAVVRKMSRVLVPGLIGLILLGCDSGSEKATEAPTTGNNPATATGPINQSDPLCETLASHPVSQEGSRYRDFIFSFCQTKLSLLRSDGFRYTGNGTPEVDSTSNDQGGDKSYMQIWVSMLAQSDPKSYFNMMRLQSYQPDEFSKVFEYDKAVTYTKKSQTDVGVSFNYVNRREDITVDYDSTSQFIEVVAGKIYLITSKLDVSHSVVQKFTGLQIINLLDGTTNIAEVFSLSDQIYDNQKDHTGTVSKAENNFRSEMSMGFRNSKKATQANSFYP